VYSSWDDFMEAFNLELNERKKDELIDPEEIQVMRLITAILQIILPMNKSQLIYIYNKSRRLPLSLIQECDLLKERITHLENEKDVQKNEYELLKKEKENIAEQLAQLQKEHKILERDLNHYKMQIQAIGEGSKELAIILQDLDECLARVKEDYSEDLDYLSKQIQETHSAKFKATEDHKKLTLEMKQLKDKLQLQSQLSPQNVQGRLLDELRTVTDMLNAALVEKNNLDIQNIELKQKIQALEKKLSEYEELTTINVEDDPCPIKGPLFQLLLPFLFAKRNTKTNPKGSFPPEPLGINTSNPEIPPILTITNKSDSSNDVSGIVTTINSESNPFELPVLFATTRRNEEEENSIDNDKSNQMKEKEDDGNPFA